MSYAHEEYTREKPMRRYNTELRAITDGPVSSTNFTDTCGNPSESYHWKQMAALRQEWQYEFRSPEAVDAYELTLTEIRSIETQVRRELYP